MISYWKMEEDATSQDFSGYIDEKGYSYNTGLCPPDDCPIINSDGIVGYSQSFNGIDTRIDVAANSGFNFSGSDSFSIELWLKKQSGIVGREVLIGRDSTTNTTQWWVGIRASGQVAFSLTSTNGESEIIESRAEKLIANGVWHHIAIVRDNNENRLYVDGQLENSVIIAYTSGFKSTDPVNIGYLNNGLPVFHFKGAMDEIAIYNRPLSEIEIQMHYYLSRDYCKIYEDPVRVMPMGDSITYDNRSGEDRPPGERTGYRWPLWTWLSNANYRVDFVGSEKAGENIQSPSFDPDNAGFPGINDDELAELLNTGYNRRDDVIVTDGPYLSFYPADVILLHIGTNDPEIDTTGVNNILDEIDEFSHNTTVLLARIIKRVDDNGTTHAFNEEVEELAVNRIEAGDKIIMVDMENIDGFVYNIDKTFPYSGGDMYDNLHPNNVVDPYIIDSGYGKIADLWFSTLQNFLPLPSIPNNDGDNGGDNSSSSCFVNTVFKRY